MVRCRDHGKGAGSNHSYLRHLGHTLCHHHINFQCDNECLVAAISKASSKDTIVMHLLHSLWFFIAHFSWYHHYSYTPTWSNEHNRWPSLSSKINISLPVQPSLVSTTNSLTTLTLPYCLPPRSQLDFSIPTAAPRNLNIASTDKSTLLTNNDVTIYIVANKWVHLGW